MKYYFAISESHPYNYYESLKVSDYQVCRSAISRDLATNAIDW